MTEEVSESNVNTENTQTEDTGPKFVNVPDNIDPKWKTKTGEIDLERLIKSQADSQASLTRLQQERAKQKTDMPQIEMNSGGSPLLEAKNFDELMTKAGISSPDLGAAFVETGGIPAEMQDKMRAIGLSPDLVAGVMAQQAKLATYEKTTALQAAANIVAPGEKDPAKAKERFDNLLAWASNKENKFIDDAKRTSINGLLQNPATLEQGVRLLMSYHREAVGAGQANDLEHGDGSATPQGAFTSWMEYTVARKNAMAARNSGDVAAYQRFEKRQALTDLITLKRSG